jgi:hypothetical protein
MSSLEETWSSSDEMLGLRNRNDATDTPVGGECSAATDWLF